MTFFFCFCIQTLKSCVSFTLTANLNLDCVAWFKLSLCIFLFHLQNGKCAGEIFKRKIKPKTRTWLCKWGKQASHYAQSPCLSPRLWSPSPQPQLLDRPGQLGSCFIAGAWNQGQDTSRLIRRTWSPVCGDKAAIMWNLKELQWGSCSHCREVTPMPKLPVCPREENVKDACSRS